MPPAGGRDQAETFEIQPVHGARPRHDDDSSPCAARFVGDLRRRICASEFAEYGFPAGAAKIFRHFGDMSRSPAREILAEERGNAPSGRPRIHN
jgi:hypothetical protein